MLQCFCCPPQQPWWQHFTEWRVERKKEKNEEWQQSPDRHCHFQCCVLYDSGCKRKNADRHGVAIHCPDTPPETSCFLEVISDRTWVSWHHTWRGQLNLCLNVFKLYLSDKPESMQCVKMQPDQWWHQGRSHCRSMWRECGGPPDHAPRGGEGHRNTNPRYTHSPMAGGLLQTSTICCSSNENGAKVPR